MKGEIELPVSLAELLDKISILEIKIESITDQKKLENISHELRLLNGRRKAAGLDGDVTLNDLQAQLKALNQKIWDGEDLIRCLDEKGDFSDAFIQAARFIRRWNDERAKVKRNINDILGSKIVEEKNHRLG